LPAGGARKPTMTASTGRTLPGPHDKRNPRAGRSRKLGRQGTTATPAKTLAEAEAKWFDRAPTEEELEWRADLEYVWRVQMRPKRARWQARGEAMREAAGEAQDDAARARAGTLASYAERRAEGVALPRFERIGTCRKRWATFGCGCNRFERPVGCDQPMLCDWCRRRFFRRHRRRLVRALGAHVRAAAGEWKAGGRRRGAERRVSLVTLTLAHSGLLTTDREELGAAWRRWYKVLHRRLGRFVYSAAWEFTPGTDGKGHAHLHVAVLWPFVDWSWLHRTWREACPTSSHVHLNSGRRDGKLWTTPAKAAKYLAHYATKGVEMSEFTGGKAGELLVATYQRRKVTASRGFFRPLAEAESCCRRCLNRWRVIARPRALVSECPLAVWFALAELTDVGLTRGNLQRPLPWRVGDVMGGARRQLSEGHPQA